MTAVVPGRPTVLLVEEDPAHATPLAQALTHAGYEVDLRTALAFPRSLAELDPYDFVILSDVPAERLSNEQMDLIHRYVRDVGGGFLMAGGEHAFGLGGYQGTRLEDLLPVRMDSERRRDELSLALALVLDCSGSMSGAKMELAKEAARATAEFLGAEDSIAVIGFAGEPDHVVRMQSARNRVRILQNIGLLKAQGVTAIFPALDAAFQELVSARARAKHVILLTDGQTREAGLPELAEAMRTEGITVTTVGLGTDVNRGLLHDVANAGGGRAYATDDPHNVPGIWPGFGAFWGELVREHMRQERQHELPMRAEVRDSVAHITVDAIGPDDAFLDELQSEVSVVGPTGAREPRAGFRCVRHRPWPLRGACTPGGVRLVRVARATLPRRASGRLQRDATQPPLPSRIRIGLSERRPPRARRRPHRRRRTLNARSPVRRRPRSDRRIRRALAAPGVCRPGPVLRRPVAASHSLERTGPRTKAGAGFAFPVILFLTAIDAWLSSCAPFHAHARSHEKV